MADATNTTLREITKDNYLEILKLKVRPDQERMVASNAVSLAQSQFYEEAWCRGIYSGDTAVGFLMLDLDRAKPEYGIWRLMVGADHQGQGHARRALAMAVDHIRTQPGASEVVLSHVEGPGNPGPFYESCGFEYTGKLLGKERVMRLTL